MRIAYVLTKRTTGGTVQLALEWARLLVDRGSEVRIYSLADAAPGREAGAIAELAELLGEPVRSIGHRSRRDLPRTLLRLRRELQGFAPDVVHAFFPTAELYVRLATTRCNLPIVGTLVSSAVGPARWQRRRGRAGEARRLTLSPDRWAAVGQVTARATTDAGYPAELVDVVYPAFTLDHREPTGDGTWITEARLRDPDHIFVISVGRLVRSKRFDAVIAAFEHLPAHYHLVVVGSGPEQEALEALVTRLGLGARVHLRGLQKEAVSLVADADLYVSATRTEGLVGYATLEAAAVGTPIVISDIPSVTELIDESSARLVDDPTDARRLASRILEAMDEPDAHRTARAREVVRDAFEPERIRAQLLACYANGAR